MASQDAIATVGKALVGLLRDGRPKNDLETAPIDLVQASTFKSGMERGVSLYLYRVMVSSTRRHLPPRIGPDGKKYRPALPLDLYYLLTPWGKTTEMQHRLLGWAMRALEDTPTLSAEFLNGYGPGTFHPDETVDVTFDPVSLQDLNNIWEIGKPNMQLSVTYVVRGVPLESSLEAPSGAPVQTRGFGEKEVGR